jgi:hypothetical protein
MFRRITNWEDQNANNLVKLYDATNGCCGTPEDACMYDVTIPTANAVNNIIFKKRDGTNKTVTFSPAVTGAANVVAAIKAAILADGYDNDSDAITGVSSVDVSTNTIYSITGDLTVVSMLHNTSTTVTATAKCDRVNRCTFFYAWPGSGSTSAFLVNGVSATIASLTLAGNTAANVVSALEGAANWPATADVTVTETAEAFEITISDIAGNTFSLGGEDFERSACAPTYQA